MLPGDPAAARTQQRKEARAGFLARHGFSPQDLTALPSDASPRRYYRLEGAGLLLLEEIPGSPDFDAFLRIAGHLKALGFSAPALHASDAEAGLALIEDFGEMTFTRALDAGADALPLYALAVDVLISLHQHPDAAALPLASFDAAVLLEELTVFPDWFAPEVTGKTTESAATMRFRKEFLAAWQEPLSFHNARNTALVLRDFHVDNLMLLENKDGNNACGILDFQDALLGAPSYDLMSMLQDARRDLPEGLEEAMIRRYLDAFPGLDRSNFMADYWRLAAQRHLRIIGVFIRLARRDGKPGYLAHMPRVLLQAKQALSMAGLTDIEELLAEYLGRWWQWPHPGAA